MPGQASQGRADAHEEENEKKKRRVDNHVGVCNPSRSSVPLERSVSDRDEDHVEQSEAVGR